MRTMGEEGVSKKYLRPIQSASLCVGLRHQCTLEAPHILWDQVEDHRARRMGCLETEVRGSSVMEREMGLNLKH